MSKSKPAKYDTGWNNPFERGTPMHRLFERRIRSGRDMIILVDSYHAGRGDGKTVSALQLAEGLDQNGGITKEKATLHPEQLKTAYAEQPQRSALVLDEGEVGVSNRDAMTHVNKAMRGIVGMGRVEEKYVVVTTPAVGFLDKDIRQMADVWATMVAKGRMLVHWIKRHPYAKEGKGRLLNEKQQLIEFKDIERGTRLREVYNELTRQKRKKIRGEEDENYITVAEHREQLEQAVEEAERERRNEIVRELYHNIQADDKTLRRIKQADGLSQSLIADAIGTTQQTVANILND